MKLISIHGNSSAFSLIDTAISLFILGLTLIAVLFLIRSANLYATRQIGSIEKLIEAQNLRAENIISLVR